MGQAGSTESTAKPRPKPEEKPLRKIYAAQLHEREEIKMFTSRAWAAKSTLLVV